VKVIDRRPKIKAHSGLKRSSETDPEAVRVKLLGGIYVSAGSRTSVESTWRPEDRGEKRGYPAFCHARHWADARVIRHSIDGRQSPCDVEVRLGVLRQVPLLGVWHDLQPKSNPVGAEAS